MFHRRLLSSSSQLATVAKSFSDVPRFDPVAQRTLKLLERKKVTTLDVGILKAKNKPITMVTAYDYPSAVHVDLAGFDILLVGDSVGMVELGMDTYTSHNNLSLVIPSLPRPPLGASRPLIVGDMPFGTCEGDPYEALKNAQRLMKHVPKFCKKYADVGERIRQGLEDFREDVENQRFPSEEYAPYKVIMNMSQDEQRKLQGLVATKYAKPTDDSDDDDDLGGGGDGGFGVSKVY
ncbi:hypothetical protein DYB31_002754 [Aphanomyces astaci]|uniref:3-methyl-2-oxobutanoate hydroxymethyltransferase n=1 Tax=Aphanomyces astaci TaxID=112090 RepID=A0A397EMX2_APHAT|nr:hypothetical protein DYB31_002754 [Aphanomyces astaci]